MKPLRLPLADTPFGRRRLAKNRGQAAEYRRRRHEAEIKARVDAIAAGLRPAVATHAQRALRAIERALEKSLDSSLASYGFVTGQAGRIAVRISVMELYRLRRRYRIEVAMQRAARWLSGWHQTSTRVSDLPHESQR